MVINDLRLSFVFTETILDLPCRMDPTKRLAGFVTEPGYFGIVDALRSGGGAPLSLQLPWPYPAGQHFWDFYLGRNAGDADGRQCFEHLVPLRLPKLVDHIESVLPHVTRLTIEGFYYAHGIGVIVTAGLTGDLDPVAAGNIALRLCNGRVYRIRWSQDRTTTSSLNQVGADALIHLRQIGFGTGVAGTPSNMFSIATIVRGSGIDPAQPLVPDSPDHRLLHGLAARIDNWRQTTAPPLEPGKSELHVKDATGSPGHVLAARRGRAVWFPGRFFPTASPRHWLSCYHRNLSLASLQTESLLGLAAEVEDAFAQPPLVPNSTQRLGRLAAGLLGRLYAGTRTYRSDSLHMQIAQSAQRPEVDALRSRFQMPSAALT